KACASSGMDTGEASAGVSGCDARRCGSCALASWSCAIASAGANSASSAAESRCAVWVMCMAPDASWRDREPEPGLQGIEWNLEIARAIAFRGWQFPRADIGLHRWNDQRRHRQRPVACLAQLHEPGFVHAGTDMDVGALLFADGGLARDLAPAGAVIVADEHAGFVGQRVHALDRLVQLRGAATGEIAARGAAIGHEQRV